MIVVMPNEHGSYYVNSKDGQRAYENFFLEELPDLVEEDYRVIRKRAARGIAGVSWGGTAAMFLALKSEKGQSLFSAVGSLMGMLNHCPSAQPAIDGGDSSFWHAYKANSLIEHSADSALKTTDFLLLTGTQDIFFSGNESAAQILRRRRVKHTFLTFKGSHDFFSGLHTLINSLGFIPTLFSVSFGAAKHHNIRFCHQLRLTYRYRLLLF